MPPFRRTTAAVAVLSAILPVFSWPAFAALPEPIRVSGTVCGDGTQPRMDVTFRQGAKNLLIYLDGGGACWDAATCGCSRGTCGGASKGGTTALSALPLTQKLAIGDWTNGAGIGKFAADNPVNNAAFNVVEIEYCTGDVFMGNRVADYSPKPGVEHDIVNHAGYQNLDLFLRRIVQIFPLTRKVIFAGSSAGGIGVAANLRQARRYFPSSSLYAIGDSGLPISPGQAQDGSWSLDYPADNLQKALTSWGEEKTSLVSGVQPGPDGVIDITDMVRFNGKTFPDVRYGFISEWHDAVMTSFASALQSTNSGSAVGDVMTRVKQNRDADGVLQSHFFFLPGDTHSLLNNPRPVDSYVAGGITLRTWLRQMIGDAAEWNDAITPE